MSSFKALIVFFLAVVVLAESKDFIVGNSQGWGTGIDYNSWASANTFNIGDSLVFQYGALHTVNEVSESDYTACSASNSIQSYGNQNTKIALTAPGTRYFICGATQHCSQGMKLAVTVPSTSSSSSSSSGSYSPGSFSPVTPYQGAITPPAATTTYPYGSYQPTTTYPYGSYQPIYNRPFSSGTTMMSGFCGVPIFVLSFVSFVILGR